MTTNLHPIAGAIRQFAINQGKVALGFAIGGAVTIAFTAVGATTSGNTLGSTSSTLISEEASKISTKLQQEAEDCASGGDGTIGGSIKNAMGIHQRLAMTPVNVDKLFSVSNDCFSGLSQIYDLSFSIPSLSSIMNSAANAVMQYAQKKVCSAVNEVTGMVTSPINEAIAEINASGKLGDLNGLTNGLIQSGLSNLDPALGSSYSGSSAGSTYTVNTNPFNQSQTSFDNSGTGSSGTGTGSTGTTTTIGSTNATINALNTQIANTQAQVMPAQMALNTAQQQLASCQAYDYNNCTGYEQQVASAQAALNAINQQLAALLQQLSGVAGSSSGTSGTGTSTQQSSQNSGSWLDSIGNLLN